MAVHVKICGITRLEDAELAISCGAWAIGLIQAPDSPRYCDPQVAAEIAAAIRRRTEVAGVFVNAPLEHVAGAAEAIGLTIVQLHGEEGPSYCAEVARSTGLKVIKAARVQNSASVRELNIYKTDFHMLDSHVEGMHGGSGRSFDWKLAAAHSGRPPLILSGGLDPENVAEAIGEVGPFAVDVASGTEASPGVKDPNRLRAFFDAVGGAPVAA